MMNQDEDDWLDDPDTNQGSTSDPIVEQEYQRMATRYSDAGYREGITDGKLATLQQGFDESFAASVPPCRRLGQLRGQANAIIGYLTRKSSGSEDILNIARILAQDLARVKRADILPRDEEREMHERQEHGDEHAFELDRNDQRDMDGLESALGSLGSGHNPTNGTRDTEMRENALLNHLERRLEEIKRRLRE